MTFAGFTKEDFETFNIEGLKARMEAIQTRIQPKFKAISEEILDYVAIQVGNEMFLHIAKHARRSVNAPVDTWMAISHNKRGYKMHPHFQVGLFDDRVFIWLALIYELPNKKAIANKYLENLSEIRNIIPEDFVISFDHMKKDAIQVSKLDEEGFEQALERFRDVKKAELLIGQNLLSGNSLLENGDRFIALIKKTIESLIPLYKMASLYQD